MPTTEEATQIWLDQQFVIYRLHPSEIVSTVISNISTSGGVQYADLRVNLTDLAVERLREEQNWFPIIPGATYIWQRIDYDLMLADILKIENMDVIDKSELDERFEREVNGWLTRQL